MPKLRRPDKAELILYLLAKLDTERIQEIDSLLESDQELDEELYQIESEIGKYIIKHNLYTMTDGIKSAQDSYQDFIRKYNDLLDQPIQSKTLSIHNYRLSHLTSFLAGGRRLLNRRSLFVFASLLIVSVCSYFFLFHYIHSVTAEEFLQNVTKAEIARTKRVAEPVVYRKLQIQKRSTGKVKVELWDMWHDIQQNKVKYDVINSSERKQISDKHYSEIGSQLIAVLSHNNFEHLFSAIAFNKWRNTIQQKTEEITKFELSNNKLGFELTTNVSGSHQINSIIAVSIIVTSDWQIVSEQIKVQGADEIVEYAFSEIDFDVVPFSTVMKIFDGDDDVYTAPMTESKSKSHQGSSKNINSDDPDLKPNAENNIAPNIRTLTITSSGYSQLQNRMQKYYIDQGIESEQSEQKVIETSRIVVSEANAAYTQAWALKRLIDKNNSEGVTPEIDNFRRNYIKSIKEHCRIIGIQLRSSLNSIAGMQPVNNGRIKQHDQIENELFKSVEKLFMQLRTHFANGNSNNPEHSAMEILSTLAYLDSLLANMY